MSFKKILLPVDGSSASPWILDRIRRLLALPGLSVTILGVAPAAGDPVSAADPRHKPMHDAIRGFKDRLLAEGVSAIGSIVFGDPAAEILREAAVGAYDLIAMASHGRTGLDRILFGSVALKILQAAPMPLLLARPLLKPDGSISSAERTDPARFQNILVPLDGSQTAEEIVPAVEKLARAMRSRLHLLTVVPGGSTESEHRRAAEAALLRWCRIFDSVGVEATPEVRAGEASSEVLDCLQQRGLDTIALTTHGHTGLARALYGSVAEKLLARATVPILVCRSRLTHPPALQVQATSLRLGIP